VPVAPVLEGSLMPFQACPTRGGEARKLRRRFWLGVSLGVVVMQAAGGVGSHIIVNVTPSLPQGFYWRHADITPIHRGMTVLLTPPDAMVPALGTLRHILKTIAGLPGETVCWGPDAMVVPGTARYVRQSPLASTGAPEGCVTLAHEQVVVVGTHPLSLDSRDVGPVHVARLWARLIPLWTWGGRE
jgi:type IV secretory pathway protease TraF